MAMKQILLVLVAVCCVIHVVVPTNADDDGSCLCTSSLTCSKGHVRNLQKLLTSNGGEIGNVRIDLERYSAFATEDIEVR